MLTDAHIVVMGGDARQLEVIRQLTDLDATVTLVGFDQLEHGFSGAYLKRLSEVDFSQVDGIVLPVSGTDDHGEIETVFSNEEIKLSQDHLHKTPSHCKIYSGISNDFLNTIAQNTERKIVKLVERDDVAILNSIPTVEGTILTVIKHTEFTIHSSNVMVLGLGRVGMSVARAFHLLGAKVTVGAAESENLARAQEMGVHAIHIDRIKEKAADTDVFINTIPAPVITAEVIQKMSPDTLIVDLASKPGGTDFRYADKRGIKALLTPGLPGIVAPKTAGQIIAKVLSRLLMEDQQSWGVDSE